MGCRGLELTVFEIEQAKLVLALLFIILTSSG
jgi:hypothetical protein